MDEGPAIPLDRPIVFVGRHVDCDVRIDSKKISRRHCAIVQLHDKLVIRDLGSTNGIYWNGQRVEEAVLSVQDEFQIANIRYQVLVGDSVPSNVASAAAVPAALGNGEERDEEGAPRNGAERKATQEIPNQ